MIDCMQQNRDGSLKMMGRDDFCLTGHHQLGKVIQMNQLDVNNDLLIYKISSTCFGQYFAHHQERETEIFTAYGILLLWWVGRR